MAFDPGTHRAVTLGFPFETITGSYERDALMKQILDFFTAPEGEHPGARPKVLPETIIGHEPPTTPMQTRSPRNLRPREAAELAENTEARKPRKGPARQA